MPPVQSDPDPQPLLPSFAPVPRAKERSNGWKPEVQRQFIEALAETGSVKAACRRVNRADHGAYMLRRHPEAAEFRKAWDVAADIGMRRIEDVAMDRALHGVEVPVYSYGKIVGTRTVFNDRLLMFMLRNRAPERFAAGAPPRAPNAVDRMELARLKAQWRKEWEQTTTRERAITATERARASETTLIENIARMHERWFTALGPRTRAAYRQFRETEIAETAALAPSRWAVESIGLVEEELAAATDEWTADDLGEELAEARAAARAHEEDAARARAEYAEWFTDERRARLWWVIDVVFGTLSIPLDDDDEEEEDGNDDAHRSGDGA